MTGSAGCSRRVWIRDKACWQQWSLNSALCGPRIAFCNRMDATVARCSLRSRANLRLWPDPMDSKNRHLDLLQVQVYM
jgi:hypothetical protein